MAKEQLPSVQVNVRGGETTLNCSYDESEGVFTFTANPELPATFNEKDLKDVIEQVQELLRAKRERIRQLIGHCMADQEVPIVKVNVRGKMTTLNYSFDERTFTADPDLPATLDLYELKDMYKKIKEEKNRIDQEKRSGRSQGGRPREPALAAAPTRATVRGTDAHGRM